MTATTVPGKWVDGIFRRVLASDVTPELSAQLAQAGLDVSVPAPKDVPREVWNRAVELAAKAIFPNDAVPQRRLGVHLIASMQSRGFVKGPWLTMAKLLGPRRALRQAAEHADSFSPVPLQLIEKSSREFEVRADDGSQPDFLAGLLHGLVEALGASGVQVAVLLRTDDRVAFSVSWR